MAATQVAMSAAFLASFDEVVIAMFISGGDDPTLTRNMFNAPRDQIDPTIASISTNMILVTTCIMASGERVCAHDSSCARELTAAMQCARASDRAVNRVTPHMRPARCGALPARASPARRSGPAGRRTCRHHRGFHASVGFTRAGRSRTKTPLARSQPRRRRTLSDPRGEPDWRFDGQDNGPVLCGRVVYRRPWQGHAMTTGPRPALLFWGWAGNIRPDSYTTHQPGFQKTG